MAGTLVDASLEIDRKDDHQERGDEVQSLAEVPYMEVGRENPGVAGKVGQFRQLHHVFRAVEGIFHLKNIF